MYYTTSEEVQFRKPMLEDRELWSLERLNAFGGYCFGCHMLVVVGSHLERFIESSHYTGMGGDYAKN